MSKYTLDLHDIYNKKIELEKALKDSFEHVVEKKIKTLIIIPGKGSGQLKRKVIRFLQTSRVKQLISRYEIDEKNFGRIIVHFSN